MFRFLCLLIVYRLRLYNTNRGTLLSGRQHLEDLLFELIEQRGFWIVPEPPHVPPGRHLVPVCYGCRRVEASLEFADCRHLSCCPNCLQQLLALNNPVHPNQPEHREPVRWAPCPQCGQRTWECSIFSCEI